MQNWIVSRNQTIDRLRFHIFNATLYSISRRRGRTDFTPLANRSVFPKWRHNEPLLANLLCFQVIQQQITAVKNTSIAHSSRGSFWRPPERRPTSLTSRQGRVKRSHYRSASVFRATVKLFFTPRRKQWYISPRSLSPEGRQTLLEARLIHRTKTPKNK